nr:PDDEXK nuclease domain-containing protein [Curtobacterium sp. VKM Ac-2852]
MRPPADSHLAPQITEDPRALYILALNGKATERHLERAVVDRIADTLREPGEGLAFVGRQVHFDVEQIPVGVASYDFHPRAVRAALPSEDDFAAALVAHLRS